MSQQLPKTLHHLVGDADGGQLLEGVFRAWLFGVDDGQCRREVRRWRVVIGDYDVDTHGPGGLDLVEGAYSAVRSEYKAGPQAPYSLQTLYAQAVALFRPVGDIWSGPAAEG